MNPEVYQAATLGHSTLSHGILRDWKGKGGSEVSPCLQFRCSHGVSWVTIAREPRSMCFLQVLSLRGESPGHKLFWHFLIGSLGYSFDKGTLLGTPNKEPQEYSRYIIGIYLPGSLYSIIFLLYSRGSLFGVPSRVPLFVPVHRQICPSLNRRNLNNKWSLPGTTCTP